VYADKAEATDPSTLSSIRVAFTSEGLGPGEDAIQPRGSGVLPCEPPLLRNATSPPEQAVLLR
jgi:hypothetical protein